MKISHLKNIALLTLVVHILQLTNNHARVSICVIILNHIRSKKYTDKHSSVCFDGNNVGQRS
jgi:hypothetical protein